MDGRINVLLYEDDLTNAILISQKLKKYKYEVSDIVSNYEDAIDSIRNNSPQIILLENHTKKTKEIQNLIKLFQNQLNIPVICVLNEDLQAKKLNSCGALKKPLNLSQLNHIVDSVLNYEDIMEELSRINDIIEQKEAVNDHKNPVSTDKGNNNLEEYTHQIANKAALNNSYPIKLERDLNQYNPGQKRIDNNLDEIFLSFVRKNDLYGFVITFEARELYLKNQSAGKQKLSFQFLDNHYSVGFSQVLRAAYYSKRPVLAQAYDTSQTQFCIPKFNKYGQFIKFYLLSTSIKPNPHINSYYTQSSPTDNSTNPDHEIYNYIKHQGMQFYNFIKDYL